MKSICTSLACWLLIGGSAVAAPGATWGEHGMALFGGKEGLYASHLPMFHAPHDYQVVLRVRLQDRAQDAALRARLDGKTALWTVAPEKFEIDRLAPQAADPLRAFRADLVLGHFERGGAAQYRGATVIVDKVLVYRRLSHTPSVAGAAHYLQIGQGRQRYLVKRIDSRPDYDHIVAIAAPPGAAGVTIPKRGLDQPADGVLDAALPGAAVIGTVYFDTRDLQ